MGFRALHIYIYIYGILTERMETTIVHGGYKVLYLLAIRREHKGIYYIEMIEGD